MKDANLINALSLQRAQKCRCDALKVGEKHEQIFIDSPKFLPPSFSSVRYVQSSAINIFIGTYRQLTVTLILLSILLIFDMIWKITHSYMQCSAIHIFVGA